MAKYRSIRLNAYTLCLASCFVSAARAQEPAKRPSVQANFVSWYESGLNLSNPLEALAGELVRDNAQTPQEFEKKKGLIVAKGKRLFDDKMVPILLKQYDAKTPADLSQALQARGMTLNALQDQFIWKVLIGELKRKSGDL